MAATLEIGDREQAVAIAEGLHQEAHPNLPRRAAYWVTMAERWPECGDGSTTQ